MPATKALLALLLFHSARLSARTSETGAVVLLEDQDRGQWDQFLIETGQCWLAQSQADSAPTRYHLEAAIAMQHCIAESVEATDWLTIVRLYDRLLELRDSPLYRLNQAIARGQAGDTGEAITQLESLRDRKDLESYLLLDCAFARIHELRGDRDNAINSYLDALAKQPALHEKSLLESKLRRLSDGRLRGDVDG